MFAFIGCFVTDTMNARLLFRRTRREFLKHFLDAFVEVADVLVGIGRERAAATTSSQQLLRLCIEQINDQCPHCMCLCCSSCLSETSSSKTSPAPTTSKPVVEGAEGLLVLRHLHDHDRHVATRFRLTPTFRSQRRIDGILNAIDKQGVFRRHPSL